MPKKRARVVYKSDRVLRSYAHRKSNMEGDGAVGDNNVSDMDHQESSVPQETGSLGDQDAAQTGDPIVQPNNVGQAVTPETSQNVPIVVPVDSNANASNGNQSTDTTGSTVGQQSQFMIEVGGALVPFQD